jgi:hypothetical protein
MSDAGHKAASVKAVAALSSDTISVNLNIIHTDGAFKFVDSGHFNNL